MYSAYHSPTARNSFNKRGLLNQVKSIPEAPSMLPRNVRILDLEELRQLRAVTTEYTSGECGVIQIEASLMESVLVKARSMLPQDYPCYFRRSRAVSTASPSRLRFIHASEENSHNNKRETDFIAYSFLHSRPRLKSRPRVTPRPVAPG